MQWLRGLSGLAAVVFLCGQAPTPTIMTHYRAYAAALEAGDLAAAETEAAAALEMSVARDGQGGRTGVLALNLAHVRLSRGRVAEAKAPAQQAFDVAQSTGGGVDPLMANLTLGRAELTDEMFRRGRDRIMPALAEAVSRPELHADAYNAALELGRKLTFESVTGDAALAWAEAVRFADLAGDESVYARAEARLGYGIAQFVHGASRQRSQAARSLDTRLSMDAEEEFGAARMALREAESMVSQFAYQSGDGPDFTVAQRLFAYSQAWRMLLDAYLQGTDQDVVLERLRSVPGPTYRVPAPNGPLCDIGIEMQPRPQFPPQAQSAFAVGAVVLRVTLDESGEVREIRPAAAVPDRWFAEAVERVAPRWTVVRRPGSEPNCQVLPVMFVRVTFSYRD